jgi:hypothetical protein
LGGRLPLEFLLVTLGSTGKPWSEISDTTGLTTDHFEGIGAAIEAHTRFLTWLIPNLACAVAMPGGNGQTFAK